MAKQFKKNINKITKPIGVERLKRMYSTMLKIRMYEEAIGKAVENKEIKTPCHLSIGQEAISVGVCENLNKNDYVFGNFRGHAAYIAKGGNMSEMISEIYCKETGCSSGFGGSMHIVNTDVGIMGNSAIVAGNISLAVGAALKIKLMNTKQVSVVFFGDGAVEEGVFFESINFASLHKLPILFICENNGYAAHMKLKDRQANVNISEKTNVFLPSIKIDGNDVNKIFNEISQLMLDLRSGKGPYFVECITYRHRGHVGNSDDRHTNIRPLEEIDYWLKKDPINKLQLNLLKNELLKKEEIIKIKNKLNKQVEKDLIFARKSNKPAKCDLLNNIYQEGKYE